jgi:hypothetical protein
MEFINKAAIWVTKKLGVGAFWAIAGILLVVGVANVYGSSADGYYFLVGAVFILVASILIGLRFYGRTLSE